MVYGGISIIFSGDFHQLKPARVPDEHLLYKGLFNGLWEGNANTIIVLEKSHRFGKDPEYGDIMRRMCKGVTTVEDMQQINTRFVGRNGVEFPDVTMDDVIIYARPNIFSRMQYLLKSFRII